MALFKYSYNIDKTFVGQDLSQHLTDCFGFTPDVIDINNETNWVDVFFNFSLSGPQETSLSGCVDTFLYQEPITDIYITGGTIDKTSLTLNNNNGGNIVINNNKVSSSVQTTGNTITELEKIINIPDNTTSIIEVYIKALSSDASQWGIWKRTLTVTKSSGTVVIREENADVDKTSSGLNANSISFTVNSGDIDIDVTGIVTTTIDWNSIYEITL